MKCCYDNCNLIPHTYHTRVIRGPQGPIGPTGPQGPTGATGTSVISGIQTQLQNDSVEFLINPNQALLFNTVLNNSAGVVYNQLTGTFTITTPGNYYADWWVSVDGSAGTTNISYSLYLNGVNISESMSPNVTSQVTGSAVFTVNAASTLQLINTSTDTVRLASYNIKANFSLIK